MPEPSTRAVVLDTDVASRSFKGRVPPTLAAKLAGKQPLVTFVTVGELIGAVRRDDIEDYKVWLAARPRAGRHTITAETHRQRMRTVRQFFERIIGWDWPGAPARNPVIAWDIPKNPSRCRSSPATATPPRQQRHPGAHA